MGSAAIVDGSLWDKVVLAEIAVAGVVSAKLRVARVAVSDPILFRFRPLLQRVRNWGSCPEVGAVQAAICSMVRSAEIVDLEGSCLQAAICGDGGLRGWGIRELRIAGIT
ncbi:unnamed protein product [Dovyalis caffra]|uniref:Uncharacterized protein n=1 Tax=Dovyalis caffra TaxID=77055 RepID=A0AAV1RLK8_9ROSI|nr:unnamed protein product [Dovyalis caffra]